MYMKFYVFGKSKLYNYFILNYNHKIKSFSLYKN